MNKDALKLQIDMCARALRLNLDGITEEEALVQPEPGGNCLNWVLGHIIASRQATIRLMKQQPTWPQELEDRYKRGSQPVTSEADEGGTLEQLRQDFEQSHERLMQGLEALPDAALNESAPSPFGGEKPRIELIAFMQFHESYHVGQTGILRRMLGKAGAIK